MNDNFNIMMNTFIIPKSENPVSSAHIPNVPPNIAILSDKVYIVYQLVPYPLLKIGILNEQ